MATIDYLKLRNCPVCDSNWVLKEYEDGTFHTNLAMEAEGDYNGAINCYRCPDCRASFPREIQLIDNTSTKHTHTPFMNP